MPTLRSTHKTSRVRNLALSALHSIAADHLCEVSDILALIIPPQPETTSSHAPAAQTGEGRSSLSSSPVDLTSLRELAQREAASGQTTRQPDAEGECSAARAISALGLTDETGLRVEALKSDKPGEASASPAPVTKRAAILACIDANPDLPAKIIAQRAGSTEELFRATASKFQRKLTSWWDYQRALQAKTTEALKKPPAEAQEADKALGASSAQPVPQQPPMASAEPALPLPPPIVRPIHRAPAGRFYLRARATGLYVHQSLEPDASGAAPMMTSDRKWAWYDTLPRYNGAKAKWPVIAEMRKEAANA